MKSESQEHGSPVVVDVHQDYLAAVTDKFYARVFKVGARECRPVSTILQFDFEGGPPSHVHSLHANCDGTKVSG